MTLDEARAAQKKEPKKIFMDVYTDWCGPCKLLDKNTFQNPCSQHAATPTAYLPLSGSVRKVAQRRQGVLQLRLRRAPGGRQVAL